MHIRLIGHSTVLFEVCGRRVLTDPWFGTWGNPAYARSTPPAVTREEVGAVDAVLLSHNHWDHTDRRFFRGLGPGVPVVAPRRSRWVTRLKGARRVVGLRPWDTWVLGDLGVTAVPALHMATTVGFVLRSPEGTAYFAGDTYCRPWMKDIGRRFSPDVALLPVTTYRIPMTMGEAGAVKAVQALQVPVVIPIHRALQPRSPLLRTRQTAQGFARRLEEAGLPTRVVILDPGEQWVAASGATGARHPGPNSTPAAGPPPSAVSSISCAAGAAPTPT